MTLSRKVFPDLTSWPERHLVTLAALFHACISPTHFHRRLINPCILCTMFANTTLLFFNLQEYNSEWGVSSECSLDEIEPHIGFIARLSFPPFDELMLAPINLGCDLRKSINLTFGNRLTTFPGVPRTIPPHPLNLYLVISNQWISRILILPLSGDSQSSDLGPTVPIGKSQRWPKPGFVAWGSPTDLWLAARPHICGDQLAYKMHLACHAPPLPFRGTMFH